MNKTNRQHSESHPASIITHSRLPHGAPSVFHEGSRFRVHRHVFRLLVVLILHRSTAQHSTAGINRVLSNKHFQYVRAISFQILFIKLSAQSRTAQNPPTPCEMEYMDGKTQAWNTGQNQKRGIAQHSRLPTAYQQITCTTRTPPYIWIIFSIVSFVVTSPWPRDQLQSPTAAG